MVSEVATVGCLGVWITESSVNCNTNANKAVFSRRFCFKVEPPSWIQNSKHGNLSNPGPEHINCNGDVSTNWKIFREAYEDYLIATGLDKKDKAIQVATLKSLMGTECKKILKRLQLSADEMKGPELILGKLEAHVVSGKKHTLRAIYISQHGTTGT